MVIDSNLFIVRIATVLAIVGGCALSIPTFAQTQPDSGAVIQSLPKAQQQPAPAPDIETGVRRPRGIADIEGLSIDITAFRITGLSVISDELARQALQPYVGKGKRFQDLLDAAAELKKLLAGQGFFLAEVVVPEQKIKDGVVELLVLEGRLGKVKVDVAKDVGMSTAYIESFVADLKPGSIIETAAIERALFLLSDLKGINIRTVFEPGEKTGSSNLTIKVTRTRTFEGNFDTDGNGSIYTGIYRYGGGIDFNNLAGRGDLFSVRYSRAADTLEYRRFSYLMPLGASGTKVGIALSDLNYRLTTATFDPLQASGTANITSLIVGYPILRSRNVNLIATGQGDLRKLRDVQDSPAAKRKSEKSLLVSSASLGGDFRDSIGGGGINVFNAAQTYGNLSFQTEATRLADRPPPLGAGRGTGGQYTKTNLTYSRLQTIMDGVGFYFSYNSQFASKNLDSSEKFSLGGPQAVRAYPQGEGSGDEGYVFTGELRFRVPIGEELPGNMVLTAFYDSGVSRLNKTALITDTNNGRAISGVGVGVNWEVPGNWSLRGSLADQQTGGNPLSEHVVSNPRMYFQFSKLF